MSVIVLTADEDDGMLAFHMKCNLMKFDDWSKNIRRIINVLFIK
jgi:hypothetical protein